MIVGQPFPISSWPTLAQLIGRCIELGCDHRTLPGDLVTEDGVSKVQYLLHDGDVQVIDGYDDDEKVPPSVIGSWERVLGITTGFPSLPPPEVDDDDG